MNEKELQAQLEKEGFKHIFLWHDDPGKVYEKHAHKGAVSFYIMKGSVTFTSGINKEVGAGERFDVPIGVEHSAIVGHEGCDWVVGEMIEGDS